MFSTVEGVHFFSMYWGGELWCSYTLYIQFHKCSYIFWFCQNFRIKYQPEVPIIPYKKVYLYDLIFIPILPSQKMQASIWMNFYWSCWILADTVLTSTGQWRREKSLRSQGHKESQPCGVIESVEKWWQMRNFCVQSGTTSEREGLKRPIAKICCFDFQAQDNVIILWVLES